MFFLQKIGKFLNLEKFEERVFFEKKTLSSFYRASLTKLEGGRCAGLVLHNMQFDKLCQNSTETSL